MHYIYPLLVWEDISYGEQFGRTKVELGGKCQINVDQTFNVGIKGIGGGEITSIYRKCISNSDT